MRRVRAAGAQSAPEPKRHSRNSCPAGRDRFYGTCGGRPGGRQSREPAFPRPRGAEEPAAGSRNIVPYRRLLLLPQPDQYLGRLRLMRRRSLRHKSRPRLRQLLIEAAQRDHDVRRQSSSTAPSGRIPPATSEIQPGRTVANAWVEWRATLASNVAKPHGQARY